MNEHLTSALSFFAFFSLTGASAALWNLRSRKAQESRRRATRTSDYWFRCADQPSRRLRHEERHILRNEKSESGDFSYSVVREERYVSVETGSLIATLPRRQVATADSETQARELVAFFEEVSKGKDLPFVAVEQPRAA